MAQEPHKLDYRGRDEVQKRQRREPIDPVRVLGLILQVVGGFVYTVVVCLLTLGVIEGTKKGTAVGMAAVALFCAAPALSLFYFRRFRAFAAGIFLALGTGALILGECASLRI